MKRLALLLVGSLALVSLSGARAAAQTTSTAFDQNFDVEIDGEAVERGQYAYVTAQQCKPEIDFKFIVQNYLTQVTVLEAWVSSGNGTVNCNTGSNRAIVNNNQPACWQIGSLSQVMGKAALDDIPANSIFRNGANDDKGCPEQANTKYTVYFVPLDNPTSSNPSSPPEPSTGVQQLKGVFTLYTLPPTAPTGVEGQSGESQVGIKWHAASGSTTTTSYRAYFDTSVGSDSSCEGTQLVKDAPPPEPDDSTVFSSSLTKGLNAKLTNLDGKGVEIGNYVAAAVISTDIAENEGNLSEVICIERVQTDGFLDACERDPKCAGGFDSCSLRPGASGRGVLTGLTLLAGLAIAFAIRRRHG